MGQADRCARASKCCSCVRLCSGGKICKITQGQGPARVDNTNPPDKSPSRGLLLTKQSTLSSGYLFYFLVNEHLVDRVIPSLSNRGQLATRPHISLWLEHPNYFQQSQSWDQPTYTKVMLAAAGGWGGG